MASEGELSEAAGGTRREEGAQKPAQTFANFAKICKISKAAKIAKFRKISQNFANNELPPPPPEPMGREGVWTVGGWRVVASRDGQASRIERHRALLLGTPAFVPRIEFTDRPLRAGGDAAGHFATPPPPRPKPPRPTPDLAPDFPTIPDNQNADLRRRKRPRSR